MTRLTPPSTMGIGISGPSYIYGNNMLVIHNTQRPESMPKKKINSIYYQALRKSVAMRESLTGHIGKNENVGNIATKVLYGYRNSYTTFMMTIEMRQPLCFYNPSLI